MRAGNRSVLMLEAATREWRVGEGCNEESDRWTLAAVATTT
jgi:hypothetical protein